VCRALPLAVFPVRVRLVRRPAVAARAVQRPVATALPALRLLAALARKPLTAARA
jgi:hypothetical protein